MNCRTRTAKSNWCALVGAGLIALSGASAASADNLVELGVDAIKPLEQGTDGINGFDNGRGVLFTTNKAITVQGADLFTASTEGIGATFELWHVTREEGDLSIGATELRIVSTTLQGDRGFLGASFEPIILPAGEKYLVRVSLDEPADENWFFGYDIEDDPSINKGSITVLDGTQRGDTDNSVMPLMALRAGVTLKNVKVRVGDTTDGDTDSLRASDGNQLEIRAEPKGRKFRTKTQTVHSAAVSSPGETVLLIEASASRSGVKAKVQMFDFDARRWERVGAFELSRSDRAHVIDQIENPGRFFSPSGKAKVRVISNLRDRDYEIEFDQIEVLTFDA